MPPSPEAPGRRGRLLEVASVFGRLGATAFGGPAAHLALMEDEVVSRRGWVTRERFLDLVSAANLVPGPNSTELAIHLGYVRAGFPGLVVAGAAFILPAALIVSALAWVYVRLGALPEVASVLTWVKPVVLAVIAQALWRFGRTLLRSVRVGALAAGAALAAALGVGELVVLVATGAIAATTSRLAPGHLRCAAPLAAAHLAQLVPLVPMAPLAADATAAGLFVVFLKIGSVLYGSGYVLLAFLQADLVERLGWLTEAQLLDAVAIGQVTPGPLFTTATFVGYLLAGGAGAAAATVGIFLPAFVFVAISGPLVRRIRSSPTAASFLDGVNAASLALMAVVTVSLAGDALRGPRSIAVAVAAFLLGRRIGPAWLVLASAAAGWVVSVFSS